MEQFDVPQMKIFYEKGTNECSRRNKKWKKEQQTIHVVTDWEIEVYRTYVRASTLRITM